MGCRACLVVVVVVRRVVSDDFVFFTFSTYGLRLRFRDDLCDIMMSAIPTADATISRPSVNEGIHGQSWKAS